MKAFKCDRCGKHYIKNNDEWTNALIFRVSWNYNEIDLCDDCLEGLQKWMDIREVKINENLYTPEEVGEILIIEGQEHASKYGLKLGDTIKFTPTEVEKILKAESEV